MSARNSIANLLFLRLAFQGILLHGMLCIAAVGMILATPFVISDFWNDVSLARTLSKEGEIIDVPLANRDKERYDSHSGKHICYLELPDSAIVQRFGPPIRRLAPYLREKSTSGLHTLQIYRHPALIRPGDVPPRIVEATSDRDWYSIFLAVRGETYFRAVMILCLKFVVLIATCYAAVKIYFLIKGGLSRRRRHRRR